MASPDGAVDRAEVQRRVLDCFQDAAVLNREALFNRITGVASSDVERAVETLERERRAVRFTDRGCVWVALSKSGAGHRGESGRNRSAGPPALIHEHPHPIGKYDVVVLGIERTDGTWAGWIQFRDRNTNEKLRTGQETSQPDRDALEYWASGLEDVYLEGALRRAEAAHGNKP